MKDIQIEQFKMVKNLAKPGEAIVETLTPRKAHLYHMTTALFGEAWEIKRHSSRSNLISELGDFKFYLYGIYQEFDLTMDQILSLDIDYEIPLEDRFDLLVDHSYFLFDLSKKWIIHAKASKFLHTIQHEGAEDAIFERQLNNSILVLFYKIEKTFAAILESHGLTDDEILEANQVKLVKGTKPRHASGVYSDEAQTSRADEQ